MTKQDRERHVAEALRQGPMPGNEHERTCWGCGNVAIHEDAITPWVCCKVCGSQDTRRKVPRIETQAILAEALKLLDELKGRGWTRADFAAGLKDLLDGAT